MPDAVRVATLARDARKDAAWLAHVAATGHHDGLSSRNTVECQECPFYYIDGEVSGLSADTSYLLVPPSMTAAGDDGWAPSASAFVRDLDEMAMRNG